MNNMSFSNIRPDFEKSHGSYVYDKNTDRKYLDFMSLYSSLAIGYNHPIFDENFDAEIKRISKIKNVNCEFESDEYLEFLKEFIEFTSVDGKYTDYHFACTGALGVEAACKTAMTYTGKKTIVAFNDSYHGISAYGNFLTSRTNNVWKRLKDFPDMGWPKVSNLDELKTVIQNNSDIAGVLVEPIRGTQGDIYFPHQIGFFHLLRQLCDDNNIPLIFDEVQTGFGATGNVWYFEHTQIEPDIVAFGKKSQVSGMMCKPKFNKIFENPKNLSVTFDGDLIDMIRSKYIIRAIKQNNLLENISRQGRYLKEHIQKLVDIFGFNFVKDIRGYGGILAYDFEKKEQRDIFFSTLKEQGMLVNPTADKAVRMRPNLAITDDESSEALEMIKGALNEVRRRL